MSFLSLSVQIKSLKNKSGLFLKDEKDDPFHLVSLLGTSLDEILINFNQIILSGDYLFKTQTEEARRKLTELKTDLVESIEDESITIFYEYLYTKIIPVFEEIFNKIIALADFTSLRYDPSSKTILFEASTAQNDLDNYELPVFAFKNWQNAISYNINCAKIDHSLDNSQEMLNDLIILYESIKSHNTSYPDIIKTGLKEKIIFLIRKLLIHHESEDNLVYYLDNKEYSLSEIVNELPELIEIENKSKCHYSKYRNAAETWGNRIQPLYPKKNGNDKDLAYFHALAQHYKEDHKSISRLDNLFNEFKPIFEKNISKYDSLSLHDRRAWVIAYGYQKNSRFSLMLASDAIYSFEAIDEYFNQICINQEEFNIKNYFPYLKYCQYIDKKINQLIKENQPNFALIDNLIERLDQSYQKLEELLFYCKEIDFQKFVLEESCCRQIVSISGKKTDIFIASSYVLPIDYLQVKTTAEGIKNQFTLFQKQINLYKYISKEKEEVDAVALKIRDHEKNQVQILSVFAAIVIFAAGSISSIISVSQKSIKDTVQNSLGFGYALCLFVILIWLITRQSTQKISRYHKVIVVIFFFSNLLLAFWAFDFPAFIISILK